MWSNALRDHIPQFVGFVWAVVSPGGVQQPPAATPAAPPAALQAALLQAALEVPLQVALWVVVLVAPLAALLPALRLGIRDDLPSGGSESRSGMDVVGRYSQGDGGHGHVVRVWQHRHRAPSGSIVKGAADDKSIVVFEKPLPTHLAPLLGLCNHCMCLYTRRNRSGCFVQGALFIYWDYHTWNHPTQDHHTGDILLQIITLVTNLPNTSGFSPPTSQA